MNNQQTNIEICTKLLEWFSKEENSDIRFQQGLWNLGIIERNKYPNGYDEDYEPVLDIKDKHNEESVATLNKLKI